MSLLALEHITVRFGGRTAIDDLNIMLDQPGITGLIGPNGAGKTTLFNVVTGLLAPTSGRVWIDGKDMSGIAPFKRARAGVARTFQRLELFSLLTVRENILLAADVHRGWHGRSAEPAGDAADRIIEELGLGDVADARADTVSTGVGRLVEVGRAIATHPKVLLLDEPASGQDESETARFAGVLRTLAQRGIGILLVEHDMRLVMGVCATIHVLDFGRLLASGTPAEIQGNEAVVSAYLGAGAT